MRRSVSTGLVEVAGGRHGGREPGEGHALVLGGEVPALEDSIDHYTIILLD